MSTYWKSSVIIFILYKFILFKLYMYDFLNRLSFILLMIIFNHSKFYSRVLVKLSFSSYDDDLDGDLIRVITTD